MKSYLFKIVIEEDEYPDGTPGYYAYCPALKGCSTCGHTYEETLKNIEEAIRGYVEDLIQSGEPVPTSPKNDFVEVRDEPLVAINDVKA